MSEVGNGGSEPRRVDPVYVADRMGVLHLFAGHLKVEDAGVTDLFSGALSLRLDTGKRLTARFTTPSSDAQFSGLGAKIVGIPQGQSLRPERRVVLGRATHITHLDQLDAGDLGQVERLLVHVAGELASALLYRAGVQGGGAQDRVEFELLGWPAALVAVFGHGPLCQRTLVLKFGPRRWGLGRRGARARASMEEATMVFRFTGLGWLGLVLPVLTSVAGLAVAIQVGGDIDTSGLVMVVVFLLGAAVHWLVARRLNSTGTGEDRRWHDRHTLNELPIQNLASFHLVAALIVTSTLIGGLTSPAVAWGVFLGGLLVALIAWLGHRSRRRQRSVADRQELARVRGWRYKKTDPGLPRRWKALYGQGIYQMAPFGVLGGELDGFPFTVFDSAKGPRTTTWVVHLPVAYPRLALGEPSWVTDDIVTLVTNGASARDIDQVIAQRRAGLIGEDLQPDTADDGFGQAMLTPHVRHLTLAYQLVGWQIEDRDLILTRLREIPHTAGEVLQIAERLAALAKLFPTDAAHSHGRQPTVDVPLPTDAAQTTT